VKRSEPISVCVVLNENDFENKFCLKNLIDKTSFPFHLHVYNLFFSDSKAIDKFLKDLNFNDSYQQKNISFSKNLKTLSECYNDFLKNCDTKYAVFLPSNCVVNNNWLTELKFNYESFEKSGCVSIKSNSENLNLTSKVFFDSTNKLNFDDQCRTVYVDNNNFFLDFAFFQTDKIKEMGYLNNNLKGLEIAEWTFRWFAKGYSNYYLKYESVIRLKTEDDLLKPKITRKTTDSFKKLVNSQLTIEAYE
jgi:hypothetical protein